jgi:hypothetical protein
LKLNFSNAEDSLPRFWQRRFHDFNVWSLKKRVEKLHYMHMNPLKRKLARHPKDWPWSSFSFYSKLKTGLIRIDPVNWPAKLNGLDPEGISASCCPASLTIPSTASRNYCRGRLHQNFAKPSASAS